MSTLRADGRRSSSAAAPAQKQRRGVFAAKGGQQVQLVIKRIGTFVQPNFRVVELGRHQTGRVGLAYLRLQAGAEFVLLVRR